VAGVGLLRGCLADGPHAGPGSCLCDQAKKGRAFSYLLAPLPQLGTRRNQSHPAKVIPSWHGDAVGHFEGDTLVIDTVGIKTDRPFAIIDLFAMPYTEKLHVVERYRLLDHEAAKGTCSCTHDPR
jgi:hypothetical protein